VYAAVYTHSVALTVPIRRFRQELAMLLDQVERKREHVTITRNGSPAAVLIPVDEYIGLEEPAEILADPETVEAIERGREEAERGELVDFDEILRSRS
jgi:antitoxin YefM